MATELENEQEIKDLKRKNELLQDHVLAKKTDAELRDLFAASPGLQDEFSTEAAFVAYLRHLPPLPTE
jgi:hypothetical protein